MRWLWMSLLFGCSSTGRVEGEYFEDFDVRSGYALTYVPAAGDPLEGSRFLTIVISNFDDACTLDGEAGIALAEAETDEERAEAYAIHPVGARRIVMELNVTGMGDDLAGEEFTGMRYFDEPAYPGVVWGYSMEYLRHPTPEEVSGTDWADYVWLDQGRAILDRYEPDGRVAGNYDGGVFGASGSRLSDLVVDFDVEWCPE